MNNLSFFTFYFLVLTLTINHSSLTINCMSAPSNLNTNRLFSDINCTPFTTQNDFSKTDMDGLASHNPTPPKRALSVRAGNMKDMSVPRIYNTTRLSTDVFCHVFQNPKHKNHPLPINPSTTSLTRHSFTRRRAQLHHFTTKMNKTPNMKNYVSTPNLQYGSCET